MTWYDEMLKQREEGREEGRAEGEKSGAEKERMGAIRAIMGTLNVTAEKAMEILKIDKSLWKKYSAML